MGVARTITCAAVAAVLACTACATSESGHGSALSPTVTSSAPQTKTPSRAHVPAAPTTTTATTPPTWASTFADLSSGVERIDVSTCDSLETGTGFLVGPNLVATVAHVVENAGTIRVTSPTAGLVTAAEIVGYDHDADLALIRTRRAMPGHVFSFARSAPPIGTEMAAIGFPLARSMQLSVGHITGTHDHRIVSDEFDLSDVLLSDAALNHGNSGGPWITLDGQVIALDESGPPFDQDGQPAQGNNGGVSGVDAAEHIERWMNAPSPLGDLQCGEATAVDAAEDTLLVYFLDIDRSDYASAYAQLDSGNHPQTGLPKFIDGVKSSDDSELSFGQTGTTDGQVYVDVSFTSHQQPGLGQSGEACTKWTLRYEFVEYNGVQLMHDAPAIPGTPGHAPC